MKNLLILGAGQYGMVTKEVAESMKRFDKIAFLDDNNPVAIGKISDFENYISEYEFAIVAIGNPEIRMNLLNCLEKSGFKIPVLIHNRAYISQSAIIEAGTIIEPMAVVHTDVHIKKGCLISAGAILNHNCVIGEGSHINCGSIVTARMIIEKNTRTECGIVLK